MSDINLDFIVANNTITITPEPIDVFFTPTDIQLTYFGGGLGFPGGSINQVQVNGGEVLIGASGLTYNAGITSINNASIDILNVNGISNLGPIGNVILLGGSNGYLLSTNGSGNLTWIPPSSSLNAPVANVHIYGGLNGYVLQTDGAGNLSWTAQTGGGGGNGLPGGANTQVQFNDAGSFGGDTGFTYNNITNTLSAENLNVTNVNSTTITTTSNANIGGDVIITGKTTINNTTSIQQAQEKITANTVGSTGTIDYDLLTQAIIYKTAISTNNFTLNIRGNATTTLNSIMSSNQSMTCCFYSTNGSVGYYCTGVTIDGNVTAVKWVYPAGAPSGGTPNGIDVYNINIIKTASATFTVLMTKIGYQ